LSIRGQPTATLFPYTTLFRSRRCVCRSVVTAYKTSIVVASRRSRSSCMGTPNPLIRSSELDMYKAYLKEEFKCGGFRRPSWRRRSEEHTSELQSRFDLVCRLL